MTFGQPRALSMISDPRIRLADLVHVEVEYQIPSRDLLL